MKLNDGILICLLVFTSLSFCQNSIDIKASLDVQQKTIAVSQNIRYQNTSQDTLNTIYLNDWNNAYSTKKTPLAKRFTEEFNDKFHFAKSEQRGYTTITDLKDDLGNSLNYNTTKAFPDVVEVSLKQPLLPNSYYDLSITYNIVVPDDTFTGYGISEDLNFHLKYWYLTPAVYDGKWEIYSNKNLDDLYVPPSDMTMEITFPLGYQLVSELNTTNIKQTTSGQTYSLEGKQRVNTILILNKRSDYKFVQTDDFTIMSNVDAKGISPEEKALITDKITRFITEQLGAYPHERLLITNNDYKKDPLYGLNQLPDFIRPFPDNFQYELKLLKTALNNYLENTLIINPRKDYWLRDGIQIYYLMKYVEDNYPDTKLIGTLADIWGVRSFHAADLKYNDQFNLFYMQMARTNRDQALTTSKDSLLKFNANIAGKYKAGIGLRYLDDFVNSGVVETQLSEYLRNHKLKVTNSQTFENELKKNTPKNIDWFFTDYINTRAKIDFKIDKVVKTKDSIKLTIKNKRDNQMPVSLFTLGNDSILSKSWVENISHLKTVTIARDSIEKLALNYDNTIPEFNLRDNYRSLKGFLFNNKPFQFRVFKDVEDPYYNQIFLMPLVEFNNIYDGLTLGAKFYNKTLLRKRLNYKFSPQYATKSKSFTGGGSVGYTHNIENQNLYNISYGFGAKYNAFAEDSFVTVLTPSLSFVFRNDDDFRSNESRLLNFRYLSISRDFSDTIVLDDFDEPDYSVLNVRYVKSNPGLVNFSKWFYDLQFAQKFGKISLNYEYRKLSETNRQFNFRVFAGSFLFNKTDANSNYFSFALDRPTDYLFDYNYLGRSEDTGIYSQQIIIAEGGFKSKLDTAFANQWMVTSNVSTTIWKYIEGYGDIGLLKNKSRNPAFVYDSGIKVDLVTDYFELYFPVYSNLGWEIAQPNYDQKIRIKFTLDPGALLGLFRRKWY
ncbi:metalloprotease [Sediminibacter sp. Hel_I_10]|uniref:metalloprotease n=1 Tax=Sediminibacter sp. Hel_I_10 TaxID=1392490 RepID=UPI000568D405|nr:metalloprotease [Sediminibacter sp. Hel_I_10]